MPDNILNELDKNLLHAFIKFHKVMHPHNLNVCKNNSKLKFGDYNLLFHIKAWSEQNAEGASSTELSSKMHVKPPTINPLLLSLENANLIERKVDPSDRRILRITLTPEGLKLTNEIEKGFCNRMHGLVNYLGADKSNELIELINGACTYLIKQNERS